jgi:UDP-glucose 4-epimerase
MEAIRDAGVQRVVLASSGAIYGEQPHQPVTEDMAPRPTSPYAVSKLAAEYYVSTIGSLWGIETVALRIFNAYGPGQAIPPAHAPVIPQFMKHALGGGSLVVFGDGEQTRDFVYIDDVVEALATAAVADGIDRQIINVGSGQETGVNALVRSIEKVTRHEAHALHMRAESGGVSRLVADLTLARHWLKYEPQVDLEIGLRHLLERDPQFQVAATSSK